MSVAVEAPRTICEPGNTVDPRVITALIAAVAGALGAQAIMFVLNHGPDADANKFAVPSVITWLVLHRFVRNKSLSHALIAGLVSPVVACLIFLPVVFVGVAWFIVLAKYWWITIPVGVGTSLLVQLFTSDYGPEYSRTPRLIALLFLVLIVDAAASPAVLRAARDPLRLRSAESLRAKFLDIVPPGSSPDAVLKAIGTSIPYYRDPNEWGGRPQYAAVPAYMPRGTVMVPVGDHSIQVPLGWYYMPRGRINATADFAFDANHRLIDVCVRKRPIRP